MFAFTMSEADTRMNGDDLCGLSIAEAAELVRTRKVSPVELTEACLSRIEKLNASLNAFITVTADSARAEARQAEVEVHRGEWRGPLHGIPIALKDLFDTAGVKTTGASELFKERVPPQDAEVVRHLKSAGAVFLGKQNMHELAYGTTSAISYFGPVRNPWERNHIAGGSSGGSAAAVAAGLCYGALGSDTGGSIRGPAHCCGIVGLKPTYGLVSTRGVIPLSKSRDHVGPLTRTVADAAIMLQAIAGHDLHAEAIETKRSNLRIGIPRDFFFRDLHPDVEAAVGAALTVLQELTASQREVSFAISTSRAVLSAEAYAVHAAALAQTPELFQRQTRDRLQLGAEIAESAYAEGLREIAQLRNDSRNVFSEVDILVTPTAPIPARAIDEALQDDPLKAPRPDLRNCGPFNINGLPTISIPCGFTQTGLPIGLQLSGPPDGESLVLQLAYAYEQATEWHLRRPWHYILG